MKIFHVKESPETLKAAGLSDSFVEAAITDSTPEIVAALVSYIKQLLHCNTFYNNSSECESQDSTKKGYGPRSWQHVDKGIMDCFIGLNHYGFCHGNDKRLQFINGTTPRTVRAAKWNLLEMGTPSTVHTMQERAVDMT